MWHPHLETQTTDFEVSQTSYLKLLNSQFAYIFHFQTFLTVGKAPSTSHMKTKDVYKQGPKQNSCKSPFSLHSIDASSFH